MKTITKKQAIQQAKLMYKHQYGKRPYNARINVFSRYPQGQYILINQNGNTVEYYF